jgi:8-oxo-dGTP diphosphatase
MSSGTLRVAAHGLCIQHERVLLTLLGESVPEAGAWGLPGGGIEWLEAPADALRRELREETGLDAVVGELLGVYSAAVAPRGSTVHFLSVVYRLRDAVGTLTDEVAGSTDRRGVGRSRPKSAACR